ncbi:uncharacterized protein P7C70_g3779, partial [Phenoliferia sp. Uapishka_3]
MNEVDLNANRPIRVLSFDADISGGLSALVIADRLARQLGVPGSPARLSSSFDLIVGSGVGGVIALMLGRLGMSTDEARGKYIEMWRALFPPGTLDQVLGENRLSVEPLRLFMETVSDGALLQQSGPDPCRSLVFASYSIINSPIPVQLRSYNSRDGVQQHSWSLAEASCATFADSEFFDDFEAGEIKFQSVNASGLTNPTRAAVVEVDNIADDSNAWKLRRDSNGLVIVSIGTGQKSLLQRAGGNSRNKKLAELYKTISRSTTIVHEGLAHDFRDSRTHDFPHGRYFRFDAPELGTLDLHDPKLESLIDPLTYTYIHSSQTCALFRDCERALKVCSSTHPLRNRHSLTAVLTYSSDLHTPLEPVPPDRRLVGRWEIVDELVQRLQKTQHTAIVGLGGVGKTSLATATFHDRRIGIAFRRRVYIRCVRLDTLHDFQVEALRIRAPHGLEDGEDIAEAVRIALRREPTLLVLDNLLDIPTNEHADYRQYISTLSDIPNVTILITTRNHQLASTFGASRRVHAFPLGSLSQDASEELFRTEFNSAEHCRKLSMPEPFLPDLLQLLSGVPLGIKLVAARARSEPSIERIIAMWKDGTAWDNAGIKDRENSLQFSLSLSFDDSSINNPITISLLRLLSELPYPILRRHSASPAVSNAIDAALRCSIAQVDIVEESSDSGEEPIQNQVVKILEPVRLYIRRRWPKIDVSSAVVRQLASSYFGRGNAFSPEWSRRPEDWNFIYMVDIMQGAIGDEFEHRRHNQVMRVLIKAGASATIRDSWGWTPLHFAADDGNFEGTTLLLEAGAALDAKTHDGFTPLVIASKEGHFHVMRLLLEAGASANAKNVAGWTPLHFAADDGKLEEARLLLEAGAALDAKTDSGKTPLILASSEGHTHVMRALIKAGASATIKDSWGWTPLHFAADDGKLEEARLLLEAGAALDAKTDSGKTPLILASSEGHTHVMRALIKAGASATIKDSWGWTPLHFTAEDGNLEGARLLLEAGAALDAKTDVGSTPLILASTEGNSETYL